MEASKKRKLELGTSQKAAAYSLTNFDLTTFPPVDISVLSESYVQIQPQNKSQDMLIFICPLILPTGWHWTIVTYICHLLLRLQRIPIKLTHPREPQSKQHTVIFYWVHSLRILKSKSTALPLQMAATFSAMIHKILYNTTANLKARGHLEGFYMNTSANIVDSGNSSYKTLLDLAQKDHMEFYGRLPLAIFDTPRHLPPNTSMEVNLRLAPNTFCLNSPPLATGQIFKDSIQIKQCYLDSKFVICHSRIDQMYESALNSKKTLGFPLVEYLSKSFVIPAGNITYTSEVLLNRLPTYAVFVLVDSEAFFGNISKCPFTFLPYNLSGFKFSLNGEDLLFNNARMSVSNNDYARYYKQLLSTRNESGSLTCDVGVLEYTKYGYHIITAWDSLEGKRNRTPINSPGQVRLSLNFYKKLQHLILVAFFTTKCQK